MARGPEAFAAAIRAATGQAVDFEARLERLQVETWEAKANLLVERLAGRGAGLSERTA